MSNAIFPTLPGLGYDRTRAPQWSTTVQQAVSGRELRIAHWEYPIWSWTLVYNFLRADAVFAELQKLVGFFNLRRGAYDSFLFDDPRDDAVTGQPLGSGDGSTATFQAVRTYGGFAEPIYNLKSAPIVYVNGVAVTVSDVTNGLITLPIAPDSGAPITADLEYYWRVRFHDDTAEFEEFLYQLFRCKKIMLQGIKE